MESLDKLQSLAIKAALKAGEAILDIYEQNDFEINFKEDNSPLTVADQRSHDIIWNALQETEIPILSEEGKSIPYEDRKDWNQLWIVDPIDGTKEFINRNGEFTVNIALIENGVPKMGIIFVPVLNTLYFGNEQQGSFIIKDLELTASYDDIFQQATKLPLTYEGRKFTVVASRSHLSSETEDYIGTLEKKHGDLEMISKGSSLKICMVAEGVADCYPRFAPTMEWDTAAGHAIAKYAGCQFTDWITKQEMVYNRKELLNNWFLVSRE